MLGDLMRSGVTTFLDIASPHSKWLSLARESGIRVPGAGFPRSAVEGREQSPSRLRVGSGTGRDRYAQALAFIDEARADPSGRIDAIMAPSQIETCSEGLLGICRGGTPARHAHHHSCRPNHG